MGFPPRSRRLHERYHFSEQGIASPASLDSAAYVHQRKQYFGFSQFRVNVAGQPPKLQPV